MKETNLNFSQGLLGFDAT